MKTEFNTIETTRYWYPAFNTRLLTRFYHQVSTFPDKVALKYGTDGMSLTYAELFEKAEAYARSIRVNLEADTPHKHVCLIGDNKLELIVLEIAVLMAGATFIQLSHLSPIERLKKQLENSEACLLVSAFKGVSNVDLDFVSEDVTCIEAEQLFLNANEVALVEGEPVTGKKAAYLLYTSGSTAKEPKAVIQTLNGLDIQIENYTRDLRITADDRLSQFATLCHDQSIVDIYGALLNGAGLYVFDQNSSMSADSARRFLIENQISLMTCIPDIFSMIFNGQDREDFTNMRMIALGGDEIKHKHLQTFVQHGPGTLVVTYGATECSWVSMFEMDVAQAQDILDEKKEIPLGTLTARLETIFLPSENDGPLELVYSGPQVAQGYWNNEQATNKAFIEIEGVSYYRSGDIIEIQGDCLFYRGRVSRHAKINGERVYLGEVESKLEEVIPGSTVVAVMVYGDRPQLMAFYEGELELPEEDIRKILLDSQLLEDFMIPARIIKLDSLPRLANGKKNRVDLVTVAEEYIPSASNKIVNDYDPSDITSVINYVWHVTVSGEYFAESGGTSLTAMQMAEDINAIYGQQVAMAVDIIQFNSLELLQTKLGQRLENAVDGFPDLTFITNVRDKDIIYLNFRTLTFLTDILREEDPEVDIRPCQSQDNFIEMVQAQVLENTPKRGYIVPTNNPNNREAHPAGCLVEIEDGVVNVYITDSVNVQRHGEPTLRFANKVYRALDCQVHIDVFARQMDVDSCTADALLFLEAALKDKYFSTNVLRYRIDEKSCGNVGSMSYLQFFCPVANTFVYPELTQYAQVDLVLKNHKLPVPKDCFVRDELGNDEYSLEKKNLEFTSRIFDGLRRKFDQGEYGSDKALRLLKSIVDSISSEDYVSHSRLNRYVSALNRIFNSDSARELMNITLAETLENLSSDSKGYRILGSIALYISPDYFRGVVSSPPEEIFMKSVKYQTLDLHKVAFNCHEEDALELFNLINGKGLLYTVAQALFDGTCDEEAHPFNKLISFWFEEERIDLSLLFADRLPSNMFSSSLLGKYAHRFIPLMVSNDLFSRGHFPLCHVISLCSIEEFKNNHDFLSCINDYLDNFDFKKYLQNKNFHDARIISSLLKVLPEDARANLVQRFIEEDTLGFNDEKKKSLFAVKWDESLTNLNLLADILQPDEISLIIERYEDKLIKNIESSRLCPKFFHHDSAPSLKHPFIFLKNARIDDAVYFVHVFLGSYPCYLKDILNIFADFYQDEPFIYQIVIFNTIGLRPEDFLEIIMKSNFSLDLYMESNKEVILQAIAAEEDATMKLLFELPDEVFLTILAELKDLQGLDVLERMFDNQFLTLRTMFLLEDFIASEARLAGSPKLLQFSAPSTSNTGVEAASESRAINTNHNKSSI